ncbi:MAG: helix-turn-helix domain-containing protein [Pannonibacter sp.]
MPRRSITDEEIGLIKALLARGLKNRDIQFYFNRQDRPVNSGRITGIRNGSYGPDVAQASEAALDAFLATFKPAEVGIVIEGAPAGPRSIHEQAHARFVQRADGHWHLADGETSEQECKAEFDRKKLTPLIKAIAALANNRGGFLFVGVTNDGCRVTGLPDDSFAKLDIAALSDAVKTYLTPTPVFTKHELDVAGHHVGVIHVEKQSLPPVIVKRDGDGLQESAILYRYPGQSGRIKPDDLLALLQERDRAAEERLLAVASRVSSIGTGKALVIDTEVGVIEAGQSQITIDRKLADELTFIREGEFQEKDGAPTLRLLGEVRTVDAAGEVRERIEPRNLTAEGVLRAFLNRERVHAPLEYALYSAHSQRQWLPLFYFVSASEMSTEDVAEKLTNSNATYPASRDAAVARLHGRKSALYATPGRPSALVVQITGGAIPALSEDPQEDSVIALAIQALPDGFKTTEPLFGLLLELYERAQGSGQRERNRRSTIFRAACRLDELTYGP